MDYNGLQAAVGDFLNRSDLYAQVPIFIALAEAKMNRRLRVRQMVVNAQAMITSEFENAPPDFLAPISLKNAGTKTVLDCIAPDAMAWRKSQEDADPGEPLCYSVVGTSLEFSPAPDAPYIMYLIYFGQVPALSASNLSNWLLASAPDAYLYGALAQAGLHVEDGRAQLWGELYEGALQEIEAQDRTSVYGARLEPRGSLVV